MAKSIHVVHSQGEWKVRREGSLRASKVFETKRDAVTYGRQVGKNDKAELYIHNKNGRISGRMSFGHDPFPPKG